MWLLTCVALFAAGYAASACSWAAIKIWINWVTAEADRLRLLVAQIGTKLRDM